MIELRDYKDLIDLTPKDTSPLVLSLKEKESIVDNLLRIIEKDFPANVDFSADYSKKRLWLRAILNQIPPFDFEDQFFQLQNKLLSSEVNEKHITKQTELDFNDNLSIFQGDITTIQVDAIVNAGNSQLLGCFVPLHSCIDNIIISAAGFQVRNDLNLIMTKQDHEEPNGGAKITNAYNLPSKYIIHTVGPCIRGNLTDKDKRDLKNCYVNSLDLAKEMALHSIAFCCISTGEFRFPNDIACEIAVDTVKEWLKTNKYEMNVVFNVFKDIDRSLYEEKLHR